MQSGTDIHDIWPSKAICTIAQALLMHLAAYRQLLNTLLYTYFI
jgi:hypothetical protein